MKSSNSLDYVRPPRRYRRLVERVCDRDREWFERHPDETGRVRPYVPGEFWPLHHPDATEVNVTRLPFGCQSRSPGIMHPHGFCQVGDLAVFDDSDARVAAGVSPEVLIGVTPLAGIDCREAHGGAR